MGSSFDPLVPVILTFTSYSAFPKIYLNFIGAMHISADLSALTTHEPKTESIEASSLLKHIMDFAPPFSPIYLRLRLPAISKPFLKAAVFYALLSEAFAATDCEILNSGISTISATACCTETAGITCLDGRVTEMYVLFDG
jgi:hypothetical protein